MKDFPWSIDKPDDKGILLVFVLLLLNSFVKIYNLCLGVCPLLTRKIPHSDTIPSPGGDAIQRLQLRRVDYLVRSAPRANERILIPNKPHTTLADDSRLHKSGKRGRLIGLHEFEAGFVRVWRREWCKI